MTQPQQQNQSPQPGRTGSSRHGASEQPATAESSEQPASSSADSSGTFADGSTQAQQDQYVKEAKEANAQVKKLADAERKAREDASS